MRSSQFCLDRETDCSSIIKLGSLIATMRSRSAIATSLGVIGASLLYQNGVEWGLHLNVGILQSMVKYGIWLTPLIYIAYEVRKVVKLNKNYLKLYSPKKIPPNSNYQSH